MSLYVPAHFDQADLAALDRLVEANPLVTLVSSSSDGPVVSHVPVLYRRDDNGVELNGHVSRANAQWREPGPMLAIVHGPHAYVSPGWLPDKEAQARVPTWNYAVAHLHGQPEWFDDEPSLASLVDAMSRRFEAGVGSDWRYEHQREDHRVQLRGIIGFRLRVQRMQLKFKHHQNHPAANQRAVASQLEALGGELNAGVAALMRRHLASLH